jgi:hypothetical protein
MAVMLAYPMPKFSVVENGNQFGKGFLESGGIETFT